MSIEQFIYNEDVTRGRIYRYLNFHKYMESAAKIVCDELDYSKFKSVRLDPIGDTVWVEFEETEFGFDSSFLWNKDIKGNVENYLNQ
jgi:hypothetical protein